MHELLLANIRSKNINLTPEEEAKLKTFFIPKKIRKKQYLLQEGDISQHVAFVEKGMWRCYSIGEKGNEHIIQFAPEDWWLSDLYSFLTGKPSSYSIDALEDSELLLINRNAYEEMLQAIPKMERYLRILTQNSLIALQNRLSGKLSLSAEENYRKLLAGCNNIVQRVPQHMIASFLGITAETLSRMRKQMASAK